MLDKIKNSGLAELDNSISDAVGRGMQGLGNMIGDAAGAVKRFGESVKNLVRHSVFAADDSAEMQRVRDIQMSKAMWNDGSMEKMVLARHEEDILGNFRTDTKPETNAKLQHLKDIGLDASGIEKEVLRRRTVLEAARIRREQSEVKDNKSSKQSDNVIALGAQSIYGNPTNGQMDFVGAFKALKRVLGFGNNDQQDESSQPSANHSTKDISKEYIDTVLQDDRVQKAIAEGADADLIVISIITNNRKDGKGMQGSQVLQYRDRDGNIIENRNPGMNWQEKGKIEDQRYLYEFPAPPGGPFPMTWSDHEKFDIALEKPGEDGCFLHGWGSYSEGCSGYVGAIGRVIYEDISNRLNNGQGNPEDLTHYDVVVDKRNKKERDKLKLPYDGIIY